MKTFLLSFFALALSFSAFSQCSDLFFSEYVEGSNNNKALEIYNPTSAAIDLSGYRVARYSNGGSSPQFLDLAGMLAPADVYTIVIDKRDPNGTGYDTIVFPALIALGDTFISGTYPGPMYFNGNDAVTLETTSGTYVDIIGVVGQNPGQSWTSDTAAGFTDALGGRWWTKNHTLVRKASVQQGISTNPTFFNPAAEWDTLDINTFDHLGWHNGVCTPNGVQIIKKQNDAFFFPNPVIGSSFTVKASDVIESVDIHNILGQEVLRKENTAFRGDMKVETSNMKKGVYFINIHLADKSVVSKKLVVK